MRNDTSFARLVSLACHDLRTPLATVSGFATTLIRTGQLEDPTDRYVGMIETAAGQMAELLEQLGLVARIEGGRYEPALREVDTLALAHAAAEHLGEERVVVSGAGATVEVDLTATQRAVSALVQAALRHGGLDEVSLEVAGPELRLSPVTDASRPVLLGEELRELGAATAGILIRYAGGEVAADGGVVRIRL